MKLTIFNKASETAANSIIGSENHFFRRCEKQLKSEAYITKSFH
jgi:hypothetical protein